MLPRLRRPARPLAGRVHPRPDDGGSPRVELTRCSAAARGRLRRLAATTGVFIVAEAADVARDRPPVAVVTLGPGVGDGELVAQLRREHRADPSRRLVVIGRGTTWFDAAFRAGVDAWVDHRVDDGTLLAAIIGPWRA